mgnify:CR=1 FL=1
MNKDLKFLLKRAFDAGTMYEATLSEECSFNEFIKYVESQQLSICDVRQQRELLLAFTKHMYKQHWHGSQGHLKELITEFLESQ